MDCKMNFVNKKKKEVSGGFWNILVVDDEEEVHSITKIVLRNLEFENKIVKIYDTYNIEDTKKLLNEKKDFALIFLDIVMETDDAGLILTKFIREELNNHTSRIILRTGQPGTAPEQKIVVDYDINDYKEKTELTATKLTTSVISSIRTYNELMTIKEHEKKLESDVKEITDKLNEKNNLIHNKIMNLNNKELISEISEQLKVPLENVKYEINNLILKIESKEISEDYFKQKVTDIYSIIEKLSATIDNAG